MSNLSIYTPTSLGGSSNFQELITIEAIVGDTPVITPLGSTVVTGITDGETEIQANEFDNAQVEVFLGNVPIPGIDPGNGDIFFTKAINSDTIELSQALANGDLIKIKVFGPIVTSGSGGGGTSNEVFGELHTYAGNPVITTANTYILDTIRVYRNGLRLKNSDFIGSDPTKITLSITPDNGDEILLDYKY